MYNILTSTYNQVIKNLMAHDKNGFWYEILEENNNSYKDAADQLYNDLISIVNEYREAQGEYSNDICNFYMIQANKIKEVL